MQFLMPPLSSSQVASSGSEDNEKHDGEDDDSDDSGMPPLTMSKTEDKASRCHSCHDSDASCPSDVTRSSSSYASSASSDRTSSEDDRRVPLEVKQVFKFIEELGYGMDAFKSRMDKVDGVLDHLEIDSLRQAGELAELKEFLGIRPGDDCHMDDLSIRLKHCERELQRLTELVEERKAETVSVDQSDFCKKAQDTISEQVVKDIGEQLTHVESSSSRRTAELTDPTNERSDLSERTDPIKEDRSDLAREFQHSGPESLMQWKSRLLDAMQHSSFLADFQKAQQDALEAFHLDLRRIEARWNITIDGHPAACRGQMLAEVERETMLKPQFQELLQKSPARSEVMSNLGVEGQPQDLLCSMAPPFPFTRCASDGRLKPHSPHWRDRVRNSPIPSEGNISWQTPPRKNRTLNTPRPRPDRALTTPDARERSRGCDDGSASTVLLDKDGTRRIDDALTPRFLTARSPSLAWSDTLALADKAFENVFESYWAETNVAEAMRSSKERDKDGMPTMTTSTSETSMLLRAGIPKSEGDVCQPTEPTDGLPTYRGDVYPMADPVADRVMVERERVGATSEENHAAISPAPEKEIRIL